MESTPASAPLSLARAPGAALFFVSYETVKSAFQRTRANQDPSATLWREPLEHMTAASVGEVAACAVRVPTEVVKQRAQAMQARSSSEALRGILAQWEAIGGVGVWREIYRGWGITVVREVPFTVVQFPLWEGLKEWRRRTTGREGIAGWESGVAGSISGAVGCGRDDAVGCVEDEIDAGQRKGDCWGFVAADLEAEWDRSFFHGYWSAGHVDRGWRLDILGDLSMGHEYDGRTSS